MLVEIIVLPYRSYYLAAIISNNSSYLSCFEEVCSRVIHRYLERLSHWHCCRNTRQHLFWSMNIFEYSKWCVLIEDSILSSMNPFKWSKWCIHDSINTVCFLTPRHRNDCSMEPRYSAVTPGETPCTWPCCCELTPTVRQISNYLRLST